MLLNCFQNDRIHKSKQAFKLHCKIILFFKRIVLAQSIDCEQDCEIV